MISVLVSRKIVASSYKRETEVSEDALHAAPGTLIRNTTLPLYSTHPRSSHMAV